MRSGVLLLAAAVALSGVLLEPVQMAAVGSTSGPCLKWLEMVRKYHEEKEKKKHECEHKDCEHEKEEDKKEALKYDMVPECDDNGYFVRKQCHTFKQTFEWCEDDGCHTFQEGDKWCACVDKYTGMPDESTMTQGGDNLHCDGNFYPEPQCDPGWVRFRGHHHDMCYKFINSTKTWVEAESYCLFENGNLASIHCPETSHFLQGLTRGKSHNFPLSWVGGHNTVQGCFWMWSDGEPFDYDDWYKEEQKNRERSCLRINTGYQMKWSSGCCNDTLPFVCEKELGTTDWHPY